MKALVKSHSEKGIWLEDVPMPEVSSNDVLVKVQKTAICGTDIHIYNWDAWAKKTISVPMTTGHEFAGVIAELGESVVGLKVGDLVSAEGHIVCNRCRNCLGGRKHLCPNTVGIGVNRNGSLRVEVMCNFILELQLQHTALVLQQLMHQTDNK